VAIIIPPPDPDAPPPTDAVWIRVGWFFGIAIASALATAFVAYGLKALLR
jgi:hypothetical protein